MPRVTFDKTVRITVSIDINDDVAHRLKMHPGAIDRFLENRFDDIVKVASDAAGVKIRELLQAYAEEFTVGDDVR